jgi:hypothetical protein
MNDPFGKMRLWLYIRQMIRLVIRGYVEYRRTKWRIAMNLSIWHYRDFGDFRARPLDLPWSELDEMICFPLLFGILEIFPFFSETSLELSPCPR